MRAVWQQKAEAAQAEVGHLAAHSGLSVHDVADLGGAWAEQHLVPACIC